MTEQTTIFIECQHNFSEEQRRFVTEEPLRIIPSESESKAAFPQFAMNIFMILVVNILLLVVCLLINVNGYFITGFMIMTLTVDYYVQCLDVCFQTIVDLVLSGGSVTVIY